jgi:hypothetical protein
VLLLQVPRRLWQVARGNDAAGKALAPFVRQLMADLDK